MSYANILIVKLSAIGDVIHALPVAHGLKETFPQARITWVVEKPAYDLVANHPFIDEVVIFEKARSRSLSGLTTYLPEFVRELKTRRFDLGLDLQGLLKSALIGWFSGAPQRLVYCNAREHSDWFARKICGPNQRGHIVEQYLDVVRALGGPVSQVDFGICFSEIEREAAQTILQSSGWHGEAYAVLIPGANWSNKRWPLEHFAALVERLQHQGMVSVITGGPGDQELAREIQTRTQVAAYDLTGRTTLKQLAWVLQNARVTIGGDTGPMHLSVAVGTPTVAIMGPTDTTRNGPYGARHRAVVAPRDCVGCWRRKCEKQLDCLAATPVEAVYQAVMHLTS